MNELYTVRRIDTWHYRIVKFDDALNVRAVYTIVKTSHNTYCDCPASSYTRCKHHGILANFIQLDRYSKGWFYCDDMSTWQPPLAMEV